MKHRLHATAVQCRSCLQSRSGLWTWVLLPVLLMICGVAVLVQAKELAIVQRVNYTPAEGIGQVVIFPSHEVTYHLSSLPPDTTNKLPARFYVDLSPARLGSEVPLSLAVGEAGVRQVRTAQFSATTVRVVLDVDEVEDCRVFSLADPYRVVVEIKDEDQTSVGRHQDELAVLQELGIHTTIRHPDSSQVEPDIVKPSLLRPTEEEDDEDMLESYTASREEGETILEDVVTLEDAYNLAFSNEEQIKIAARELARANLLPWRAVALMTPRANIIGTYRREKDEIAFQPPPEFESVFGGSSIISALESWQGTFTATQPLVEPTLLPSWRLGKDSVKQSQNSYKFTIREVLFGVAQAYYNVLRGQELDEVSFQTLKLALEQLKRSRVRFRVGEVTKTDVLRAEVAVERAKRALVENDNRVELSLKVLARSIGVAEPLQVRAPAQLPPAQGTYQEFLDQAYQQREDLRAQDFAVRVAMQRKNLVLARYSPTVETQWRFPRLSKPSFAQPDKFWTLFLNFEMPLFDGGNRELDLLEAAENLTETRLQYDQLKKDVSVEVRRAFLAIQTLETTLETLRKEVALAQENYNIISKQYQVGLATILDVNTSLLSLNESRTALTNQSYAYQVALLALQRAIGTFGEQYVSRP